MTNTFDIPLCETLDEFAWDPDEDPRPDPDHAAGFDEDGLPVGYEAEPALRPGGLLSRRPLPVSGPSLQQRKEQAMTLYHVHIYREMRLYFPGIKAGTPEEAAKIAADRLTQEAELIDDCDGESTAALVDVASDDDYEHSRVIDFEPERLRKAASELLNALKDLLGDLPSVQGGVCQHCGREYHDIPTG